MVNVEVVEPSNYLTWKEMVERVSVIARQCGYDPDRKSHPGDIVVSIVPLLEAYAEGFGDGLKR
jgi:hypothetical protein